MSQRTPIDTPRPDGSPTDSHARPLTRWQERDVQLSQVRLHLREIVEPPAPPMLLLHGLGVSGAVWQAFGRRLAPEYAAVAPDLRGHGASDPAPDGSGYLPGDYADDLADLIEEVSARPVPVLGQSLGALVGICLAARYAELVSALVLVDPPIDADRPNADVPRVYRLRHGQPGELENYLLATNPSGGAVLAQALAGIFRKAVDGPFEAMMAAPRGQPALWAMAREVVQPTLLVQADPDAGGLVSDTAAAHFVELLEQGRLVKIDGSAHAVHASHPLALADAVLSFMSEL